MQIQKFPIPIDKEDFILKFSEKHSILSFQMQNGIPVLWVMVSVEKDEIPIKNYFSIYKTGQEINDIEFTKIGGYQRHIDTLQITNGCVLHLFKRF